MFLLQVAGNDNCWSTTTTRAPSIFQPLMSAAAATIGRSSITLARTMWIGGRPGREGGRPWKAREDWRIQEEWGHSILEELGHPIQEEFASLNEWHRGKQTSGRMKILKWRIRPPLQEEWGYPSAIFDKGRYTDRMLHWTSDAGENNSRDKRTHWK